MNPHAKNVSSQKLSILAGIVLNFYLFSLQIPSAMAMERLPWKINIPKRKPPKDTIPPVTRDSGIDGLWHNQAVTVILKAEDNLSGIAKTYYSLDGSTPKILYQMPIVVSKDGVYRLRYYSKDKAGNIERIKTAAKQIKIDKTPPQGSIEINNNASCTNNLQVNLQFPTARDSGGSGLSQIQFYNQGNIDPNPAGDSNWTTPESYSISKDLTLPAGDGEKKIFVRFKDAAGNWSTPVFAVIVLDTSSPAVKFLSPLEGSVVTGRDE